MRLLFATPPNVGMAFTLVPLAQAATLAGHDVLVATASSTVRLVADAGLHAVDVAPHTDFAALAADANAAFLSNRPDADPNAVTGRHFFQQYADAMSAGLVRLAEDWRADAVVHPPEGVAARAVFDRLGTPTVFHGTGFTQHPDMTEPWKRANSARVPAGWGIATSIDVAPPSMSLTEPYGLRMRYVPYNGGAVLPPWLFTAADRPRVAVTLGTVAPGIVGVDPLRWLLAAAGRLDAEFVLALGGTDPADLGPLPANVRASRWLPLRALLRTCTAVVHHGGAGSVMAALDAGLPQIVLPQGADQFDNATALVRRGAGFEATPADSAADAVRRVLADDALRAAAREVRAELAASPGPASVIARVVAALG